jgi:hypothetical protein
MKRHISWTIAALVAIATLAAAPKPKFTSVFKTPAAREVSFAGKKVAALVITDDQGLRVAGEEALARELTARGLQGVAAYRIIPREETKVPERAKAWFEQSGVEGVVAMRPVSSEQKINYTPSTWVNPYYGTLWGYYGYGWGSVYVPGSSSRETVVTVETTIYSVSRDALLWAAVSETKDPKTLGTFVQDLVTASVKELQRQGLARPAKK